MTEARKRGGGSRYLYEPFDAAEFRLEAYERVAEERWSGLERRLVLIERTLERLERRIWLAVFGAAAFLAADLVRTLIEKSAT